jgi:hypothetical protein
MNNLLRAGVELSLEKVARDMQASDLGHVLRQKIASHDKQADGPTGQDIELALHESQARHKDRNRLIQNLQGEIAEMYSADKAREERAYQGGLIGGGIGAVAGGGGSLAYDAATGQDASYKRALLLSILGGGTGAGIGALHGYNKTAAPAVATKVEQKFKPNVPSLNGGGFFSDITQAIKNKANSGASDAKRVELRAEAGQDASSAAQIKARKLKEDLDAAPVAP